MSKPKPRPEWAKSKEQRRNESKRREVRFKLERDLFKAEVKVVRKWYD